jgi:hypothetical protein
MSNDLEAATDRVFAAMDDYRTGEAVHATRQVAKALARAALAESRVPDNEGRVSTDIMSQLRAFNAKLALSRGDEFTYGEGEPIIEAAAQAIEALVAERDAQWAENEKLREALTAVATADVVSFCMNPEGGPNVVAEGRDRFCFEADVWPVLEIARAALNKTSD